MYDIQLNNKIVYNKIVKTIQSIAPYFSDFYFNPNSENYIRLLWNDKYSDISFGANDLSDGTVRFIALTALFMQPKLPDTIIIDEPELGLHPSAIAKLAGMIKSVASKGCQVIIATQSTDLISHFTPEDIVTVDQIKGESVFKRLNSESLMEWLEDYIVRWSTLKKEINTYLKENDVYVTTLIDYYGLCSKYQFPGWEKSLAVVDKYKRMDLLESAMSQDIEDGIRHRFMPYMQLHEFEGLLFNDINIFYEARKLLQSQIPVQFKLVFVN